MSDNSYDFRILIGSGETVFEMPAEWKSHISEVEVEETVENGVASKLHFVIQASEEMDISIEAFPLEAPIELYVRTIGPEHTMFYGAILSVEPDFPSDSAPSLRVYCEDFSYRLKKAFLHKQTPTVGADDTYGAYIGRIVGKYGMNFLPIGKATEIAAVKIPDDEGFAFGGAQTSAPEILFESPTKVMSRTQIEFGDTLWMVLTKFAERYSLTVGCVGLTVIMGDEDFRFRGQNYRHKLIYNPTESDIDSLTIPLLTFSPESSLKNNTQAVEIRRFEPKKQQGQQGPIYYTDPWLQGVANLLSREQVSKFSQVFRESQVSPFVEGIARQPQFAGPVLAGRAAASVSVAAMPWVKRVANLLGYIQSGAFAAEIGLAATDVAVDYAVWATEKLNIPTGVDEFLEARTRQIQISQAKALEQAAINRVKREDLWSGYALEYLRDRDQDTVDPARQDATPSDLSDRNVQSRDEAQIAADEFLKKWTRRITTATGTVRGTPTLRMGHEHDFKINAFGSIGTAYSVPYRMISVRHTINEDGYLTNFTASAPLLIGRKGVSYFEL